jgi:hypothetical protein
MHLLSRRTEAWMPQWPALIYSETRGTCMAWPLRLKHRTLPTVCIKINSPFTVRKNVQLSFGTSCNCFMFLIKVKDNKKFWEELIACLPWYDTGHIENEASNNYSIVACVLVTAETFLPSRCLATIRGFLPSLCLATIGGYTHTRRQQRDLISLVYFFKIRKLG